MADAPLNIETIFPYLNDREARPWERLHQVGRKPLPDVEVTEEVANYFLGILPPGEYPNGFYVSEPICGGDSAGSVFSAYVQSGGRWFHRYVELGGRGA